MNSPFNNIKYCFNVLLQLKNLLNKKSPKRILLGNPSGEKEDVGGQKLGDWLEWRVACGTCDVEAGSH